MGRATRARRTNRYSAEFKLSSVRLSKLPGVQVDQVAEALDIHPFMLSKWTKEVREGTIRAKRKRIVLDDRACHGVVPCPIAASSTRLTTSHPACRMGNRAERESSGQADRQRA
jgi:transposase-like protein